MEAVIVSARVTRGRVAIRDRARYEEMVRLLGDGDVEVTIRRRRSTRSEAANNYYWGVVLESLSGHTGYTPDELHEICKAKFLPKRLAVCNGNGEIAGEYVIGGSTTKLNVLEFGDYLAAIRRWALDLDCDIPDPVGGISEAA